MDPLTKDQKVHSEWCNRRNGAGSCNCSAGATASTNVVVTSNPGGGFRPCCGECKSAFQTMAAEYDRLRAALEDKADILESDLAMENQRLRAIATNVESLQREVERLRAALGRIANPGVRDGYEWKAAVVAREALRGADEPGAAPTGVEFLHTWMRTPNPMLGGVAPLAMLKAGRGEKLAQFIESAHAENGSDAL